MGEGILGGENCRRRSPSWQEDRERANSRFSGDWGRNLSNSSTLPSQDSRTPRHYPPSSPSIFQALDPCSLLCPLASSAGAVGQEDLLRPLSPDIQGQQHLPLRGLSFTQRPPDPSQLHPFRESMFGSLFKVSAHMDQRLVSLSLTCCVRCWSQGARSGLSLAGTTSKPQGSGREELHGVMWLVSGGTRAGPQSLCS